MWQGSHPLSEGFLVGGALLLYSWCCTYMYVMVFEAVLMGMDGGISFDLFKYFSCQQMLWLLC